MAIFSEKQCMERLELWLKAEAAVATGQSYQIGGRSLTRANLAEIREQIKFWEARAMKARSQGKRKIFYGVPLE